MTNLDNVAAWQSEPKKRSLDIAPGPQQSTPARNEAVIRTSHVAINPIDWKLQQHAFLPLQYPTVFGKDVAGQVVLIGEDVKHIKPGDRVIGHTQGNGPKYGAFQLYATAKSNVVAKIPDDISYADAVVLPLAISTASTALFDVLGLDLPSLEALAQTSYVLIWGASCSVGSVAIQLARAAGYRVVTTASASNHVLAKELGAEAVFDYSSANVETDIKPFFKNKQIAGTLDAIGFAETTKALASILDLIGGGRIATVLPPSAEDLPSSVKVEMVMGNKPVNEPSSRGAQVWQTFVSEALVTGALKPRPRPHVIEGGLEKVQEAFNYASKGVSAQNVVVRVASI